MKPSILFLIFSFLFLFACQQNSKEQMKTSKIWEGMPQIVNTMDEIQTEISEKMRRLQQFLDREGLGGVLLTEVRNVYWITGGLTNIQIVLNKDVGAASLLILRDGSKYVICNGSEADRLMDESLGMLGYKLKVYPWYEANPVKDVRGQIIAELADGSRIGSDIDFPGTVPLTDNFEHLRYSLTEPEIKRYSWLGRHTTEAVEEVCRQLKPGMDEYQIEAMTATALRARGILPTVLLIGVDERIYKYRHALPAGDTLQNYAMVNVVAEKWGMPIAVTRFVHFAPIPEELKTKLEKTAVVMAKFQAATVPGKSAAEIFEQCKQWYAEAGYEGEWKNHHQGGAIGYDDREYVIYPGINEVVQENQAFAWNPTITGAKVEDTFITHRDSIQVVTHTGNWPMITVELNGKKYPQPAILIKERETGKITPQEEILIR